MERNSGGAGCPIHDRPEDSQCGGSSSRRWGAVPNRCSEARKNAPGHVILAAILGDGKDPGENFEIDLAEDSECMKVR